MKLPALLALAAAGTLGHAQKCNGGSPKLDGADFVMVDQGDNAHLAPLSAIMKEAGNIVNVSDAFADGNHVMTGSASKLAWESKSGYDDFKTKKWVPQGISSSADATDEGTYDGVDGWMVSWHRDDDKSVRISFVDRASKKYRNALLVYPEADDNFREVPVHAGGIVWYGDTLWVVDTKNGIRVFDLSNIWHVGSGDGVGKKADGGYSAAGYKYVIPQIRYVLNFWRSISPLSFVTNKDTPSQLVQVDCRLCLPPLVGVARQDRHPPPPAARRVQHGHGRGRHARGAVRARREDAQAQGGEDGGLLCALPGHQAHAGRPRPRRYLLPLAQQRRQ